MTVFKIILFKLDVIHIFVFVTFMDSNVDLYIVSWILKNGWGKYAEAIVWNLQLRIVWFRWKWKISEILWRL